MSAMMRGTALIAPGVTGMGPKGDDEGRDGADVAAVEVIFTGMTAGNDIIEGLENEWVKRGWPKI